jgi:hypothetical protein
MQQEHKRIDEPSRGGTDCKAFGRHYLSVHRLSIATFLIGLTMIFSMRNMREPDAKATAGSNIGCVPLLGEIGMMIGLALLFLFVQVLCIAESYRTYHDEKTGPGGDAAFVELVAVNTV